MDDPFARNVFFDRASKGGNPDVEPYRVANALFHVPEFDLIAKTSAPWNPIFDSFERHGREHSKVPLQLLIAPFFGAERSIFRGCKTAAWICPFFKQRFTIFDGVYGYNMRLDEWQVTDWHDKSIPYLIPEEEQVLHWMSQSPAAKMYRKAMQHYATLCRTSRPLAISSMRGSQMQAVSAVNANWGPMDILNFDIRTVPKLSLIHI